MTTTMLPRRQAHDEAARDLGAAEAAAAAATSEAAEKLTFGISLDRREWRPIQWPRRLKRSCLLKKKAPRGT